MKALFLMSCVLILAGCQSQVQFSFVELMRTEHFDYPTCSVREIQSRLETEKITTDRICSTSVIETADNALVFPPNMLTDIGYINYAVLSPEGQYYSIMALSHGIDNQAEDELIATISRNYGKPSFDNSGLNKAIRGVSWNLDDAQSISLTRYAHPRQGVSLVIKISKRQKD